MKIKSPHRATQSLVRDFLFFSAGGLANYGQIYRLIEAGVLDNKIVVAGFIAEAKPGFPHAETGNRRSKQKIKNSCVCV
jgi:hypothetical protein